MRLGMQPPWPSVHESTLRTGWRKGGVFSLSEWLPPWLLQTHSHQALAATLRVGTALTPHFQSTAQRLQVHSW